jgi:two-component system cell cycle response regulator
MTTKSRILIVDDNSLNTELLTAKLSSEEYEILHSYSGEAALKKADRELPDLILLAIIMPGLDGYEVTKRLKSNFRTKDIPIILITASHGTEDKRKGLEAGADEFLNSPVDTSELRARIKSLLSLKQYREQLQVRTQSEKLSSTVAEQHESTQEKTLLLVEDDEVSIKLILNYLAGKPYKIEPFTDGIHAINRAKKGDVDLILLDLLLPGMDGFEVCQHLKGRIQTQNIQIVMITCLKDTESRVRGIELGADDFLIKPVNREILTARITALLRKKEYFDRLTLDYERALHSAVTDRLTGLYNHTYFKHFLQLEIDRALRQRHPLTLMLFDIDDFKKYNDTLGHLAGDKILRELGQLILKNTRKIDLAARYGGEEFAVVLTYTDMQGGRMVAERLRRVVESHPFSYKTSFSSKILTVSIGVAGFYSDIRAIEELIERSDMALYRAKKEGKNRVCLFSDTA